LLLKHKTATNNFGYFEKRNSTETALIFDISQKSPMGIQFSAEFRLLVISKLFLILRGFTQLFFLHDI